MNSATAPLLDGRLPDRSAESISLGKFSVNNAFVGFCLNFTYCYYFQIMWLTVYTGFFLLTDILLLCVTRAFSCCIQS